MHERLIEAVKEAVHEIVETMLFMEVESGPGGVGRAKQAENICAVVGYNQGLEGSVRLSAPTAGALKVAGALLGEERDSMDAEMQDGFGEMANMVAGGIQSRLEADLGAIGMTPPMVVRGNNYEVDGATGFEVVHQLFTLEGELFFCEIYFDVGMADAVESSKMPEEPAHVTQIKQTLTSGLEPILAELARPMVQKELPRIAERVIQEAIDQVQRAAV
ncbi:inhibitor of MCP methylation-like protein [Magnetococcus marinus MC-1]|uniref:Inhibitor of MCP methylation-like protein n=1 Tax=Magnetococcus marinus (strain ATCC BAA-1437 / JCM 17883 / MC-1) TaxID=156889 RepID=A0L8I4_MAGMM|nr:chemotaxis protein CheX [Magnetococcus marinus]ABK44277.1 inhibitor of MCP methylation-like protein [Magnetococcus marinus MC-1]